jgi:hypothetical protein
MPSAIFATAVRPPLPRVLGPPTAGPPAARISRPDRTGRDRPSFGLEDMDIDQARLSRNGRGDPQTCAGTRRSGHHRWARPRPRAPARVDHSGSSGYGRAARRRSPQEQAWRRRFRRPGGFRTMPPSTRAGRPGSLRRSTAPGESPPCRTPAGRPAGCTTVPSTARPHDAPRRYPVKKDASGTSRFPDAAAGSRRHRARSGGPSAVRRSGGSPEGRAIRMAGAPKGGLPESRRCSATSGSPARSANGRPDLEDAWRRRAPGI